MFEAEAPGILARQRVVGFDRYTTKLATKLGKQALRLVIRKRGLAGILPNDRLEVGNDTLEVGCWGADVRVPVGLRGVSLEAGGAAAGARRSGLAWAIVNTEAAADRSGWPDRIGKAQPRTDRSMVDVVWILRVAAANILKRAFQIVAGWADGGIDTRNLACNRRGQSGIKVAHPVVPLGARHIQVVPEAKIQSKVRLGAPIVLDEAGVLPVLCCRLGRILKGVEAGGKAGQEARHRVAARLCIVDILGCSAWLIFPAPVGDAPLSEINAVQPDFATRLQFVVADDMRNASFEVRNILAIQQYGILLATEVAIAVFRRISININRRRRLNTADRNAAGRTQRRPS